MSDFLEVMNAYFRGERMLAWAMLGLGLGMLAFAFFVYRTQTGGFMWGLVAPLAIVGIMASTVGPFFAFHNARIAEEIAGRYANDPAELATTEGERMTRVNQNWPRLKMAWAVITIVALALLLLVKQDWANGLGLALMILVTVLFCIDVFGERRALPYSDALAALPAPAEASPAEE